MNIFSLSRTTGLLFVVGLLFAGIGIFLKPANVNAASVYDDVIETVDELIVMSPDGSQSQDITLTWGGMASELSCWNDLNTAINDGSYTVVQQVRNSDSNKDVTVTYKTTPAIAEFSGDYLVPQGSSSLYGYVYFTMVDNNDDVIKGCQTSPWGASTIANATALSSGRYVYPFVSTFDIDYPLDYEGEIIPDTYTPPSAPQTNFGMGMTPDFRYEVNDYDVTLTDITNPQSIDEFEISLCMFQVPNNTYGDNFTEYAYDCDLKTPVLHTFSEYASYNVLHRMYSEENDLWYETSQIIKIDGSTYAGTAGLEQSGNSIPDILKRLTVPTFGLQSALVAPIEFVRTIPELAGVCEPISVPLPYIDGDLDLPCMTPIYQSHFNAFLLLWQVSLTALVSYATVNKVFAKLRQTYNPKQDRIEPTNL